ncbi:MAG TPA: NAD(P)(+) transhydrogenase (Re/Si-specific) subunit beta, partial [Gammaproteobacteria bacterium]
MNLPPALLDDIIQGTYFLAAVLFILGLKRMSSPKGARGGIVWAGVGMLVATLITFLSPGMHNFGLMLAGILIGGIAAWLSGKRVAMTAMPQMVALYNGMGGGAAAAIAAAELLHPENLGIAARTLAAVGALIGTVSFSGSLIAFAKLQGLINKSLRFKGQQLVNGLVFLLAVVHG